MKREELIEKLKVWKLGLSGYVWHNEDEQAYQEIVELIKKPEVNKEWTEKRAKELANKHFVAYAYCYRFRIFRNVIRSLVEEIK